MLEGHGSRAMPLRRRALTTLFARAAAASIADAAPADVELASLYDQVVAASARTNEAGISHEEWAERCDDCDALAFRLCGTPTRTATGLAIKLRAFALLADGYLSADLDPDKTWSGAMLAAILVDADAIAAGEGVHARTRRVKRALDEQRPFPKQWN